MKSRVTAIPKLLGDPVRTGQWELTIKTKHEWITMTFSNAQTARKQFDLLKSQGVFSGQWITEIELKEVYASHE